MSYRNAAEVIAKVAAQRFYQFFDFRAKSSWVSRQPEGSAFRISDRIPLNGELASGGRINFGAD